MANKTLINGKNTSEISFFDRGLQYGDGLFETIAVQNNTLLCWNDHLNRLLQGCERLNIPFTNGALLKDESSSLIKSVDRGIIKIIVTRGQGGRGYALPDNPELSRVVSLYPWPEYPEENASKGINARVCNYRYSQNSALAGIKHLNRLEQVLARSEWTDHFFAEGIVMDQESNIIEGTMTNIFCIINDVLCTPDLTACGVEGIIRKKIIELAPDLKMNIKIKKISLEALKNAEEVFLCNSIIGIWPIKMINEKSFSPGKKTQQIKHALQKNHCISA